MQQKTPYTLSKPIKNQREEYIKRHRNKDIKWKQPANKERQRGRESMAEYWKTIKNNKIGKKSDLPKFKIRSAKLPSIAKNTILRHMRGIGPAIAQGHAAALFPKVRSSSLNENFNPSRLPRKKKPTGQNPNKSSKKKHEINYLKSKKSPPATSAANKRHAHQITKNSWNKQLCLIGNISEPHNPGIARRIGGTGHIANNIFSPLL